MGVPSMTRFNLGFPFSHPRLLNILQIKDKLISHSQALCTAMVSALPRVKFASAGNISKVLRSEVRRLFLAHQLHLSTRIHSFSTRESLTTVCPETARTTCFPECLCLWNPKDKQCKETHVGDMLAILIMCADHCTDIFRGEWEPKLDFY